MSTYGLEFEMEYRLIRKFTKAGATSRELAVSDEDANLDVHEQFWLEYFAGVFLGKIKKPKTIDTTSKALFWEMPPLFFEDTQNIERK